MDITRRPYEQDGDPSHEPAKPEPKDQAGGHVGDNPDDDDLANLLRRHERERREGQPHEADDQDRAELRPAG